MGDHQVGGHRRGDGGSLGGWTQEGRWGIIRWVDTGGEMGDHQVGGPQGWQVGGYRGVWWVDTGAR